MKKIYQYLFVLIIGFSFQACERNLDPMLYGTITTNNFFRTSQDLDAATTSIYWELRVNGWAPYLFSDGSSFAMDEVATGEWTTKWSWTSFLNGTWNVAEPMTDGFYNRISIAVTRCTYTLAKIEESPVSAEIKKGYTAQIRALRAFFVYDIYRLYGPMPLITEASKALIPDPDYKPIRPSGDEVKKFIETELRAAANALPIEQQEYGKVTKGASLHYLLKFYMHEKNWQNALNIANEIIGLGFYNLENKYASVFSAQNEKNRELIFVVVAEPIADWGNHTYVNILPGDFKSPFGNSVDGWNGHRMPWAFYDTFDPTDKRRELALAEYENKSGKKVNLRTNGDIGALPLKYGIDPQAIGTWAGNDKVLDRYAEVLLFKAEALNELNGPNQESVDLINKIRSRAFAGGSNTGDYLIALPNFPSKQSMRDWILKERGWEFWYEGKRREDLIRMGKYVENGKLNATNFSDKNLLFPIPTRVMIENPNLTQNQGY